MVLSPDYPHPARPRQEPLAAPLPTGTRRCAWSRTAAARLSARPDLSPPGDVVHAVTAAAQMLRRLAMQARWTAPDAGPWLLSQRAMLSNQRSPARWGWNLRGSARFWRLQDGWIALNLPRPADIDALEALTQGTIPPGDPRGLHQWFRTQPAQTVQQQAMWLGLAASIVPAPGALAQQVSPWHVTPSGTRLRRNGPPLVVDFSGLWAGPLATRLLAQTGARVLRVHARSRPHRTPAPADRPFEGYLARGKSDLIVPDLTAPALTDALAAADVIVTASRQTALARMPVQVQPHQLHLRITAHGVDGMNAPRIGYGDDAAAAAGAVLWDECGTPGFAADALGDPVTGLLAALSVLDCLRQGGGGTIDLNLELSCRWAVGPDPVAKLPQP